MWCDRILIMSKPLSWIDNYHLSALRGSLSRSRCRRRSDRGGTDESRRGHRCGLDARGVGITSNTRLALGSGRSSGPGDSTALQAIFSAEGNVVGNQRFKTEHLFNAETIQSRTNNVGGKSEVYGNLSEIGHCIRV